LKAEILLNHGPHARLVGYQAGDFLRNVYHLQVDATDDVKALDTCFQIFSSRLPRDYHERPVTVGDVIRLNGARMWAVKSQGWARIPRPKPYVASTGKMAMKNKEAVDALAKCISPERRAFSGHEAEVNEILNKVRRDEWHDILITFVED
jgi:hypothetical protein